MTGLIPGETYYYTVGSAAAWSEMQSFVAPEGDTNSFSFLYLGDVQYNLSLDEYQDWGQLLANAYENYGDAAFAIMCGDMVNNGRSAGKWQAFLAQASSVFSRIPMMAVPGNHESNDIKTGKPTLMNKLLSLLQNGLSGFLKAGVRVLSGLPDVPSSVSVRYDWSACIRYCDIQS